MAAFIDLLPAADREMVLVRLEAGDARAFSLDDLDVAYLYELKDAIVAGNQTPRCYASPACPITTVR